MRPSLFKWLCSAILNSDAIERPLSLAICFSARSSLRSILALILTVLYGRVVRSFVFGTDLVKHKAAQASTGVLSPDVDDAEHAVDLGEVVSHAVTMLNLAAVRVVTRRGVAFDRLELPRRGDRRAKQTRVVGDTVLVPVERHDVAGLRERARDQRQSLLAERDPAPKYQIDTASAHHGPMSPHRSLIRQWFDPGGCSFMPRSSSARSSAFTRSGFSFALFSLAFLRALYASGKLFSSVRRWTSWSPANGCCFVAG